MKTSSTIPGLLFASTALVLSLQFLGAIALFANPPAVPRPNQSPLAYGVAALTTQTFAVGNAPYAIASDGTNVWVPNYFSNSVSILRNSDGALMGTYATGADPAGIAFDGSRMWVVNNAGASVRVIQASNGANLQTVSVGSAPVGVDYDGANIWVTNWGNGSGNTVSVIRASDYIPLATYTVGSGPFAVAHAGSNVWVANNNGTLSVLRAIDGYHVMTPTVGAGGNASGLAFDGTNMWATNFNDNSVSVVRASAGFNVITATVGTQPFGIAFDGTYMWVSNYGSNSVSVVRASDGAYFTTIQVGTHPQGVAFDGSNIWVANFGSNNVTRISGAVPPTPDSTFTPPSTCTPTRTATPFLGAFLPLLIRQPTHTPTATPTSSPTPTQTSSPIPVRPRLQDGYYWGSLIGGEVWFYVADGGQSVRTAYYAYDCGELGYGGWWLFGGTTSIGNGEFSFGAYYDRFGLAQKSLKCSSTSPTQASCVALDLYSASRFCRWAQGYANRQ